MVISFDELAKALQLQINTNLLDVLKKVFDHEKELSPEMFNIDITFHSKLMKSIIFSVLQEYCWNLSESYYLN